MGVTGAKLAAVSGIVFAADLGRPAWESPRGRGVGASAAAPWGARQQRHRAGRCVGVGLLRHSAASRAVSCDTAAPSASGSRRGLAYRAARRARGLPQAYDPGQQQPPDFFFLITRRGPRSTLFPYTTLFRSGNPD